MCARLAATSQIVTVADALSKRLPAGAMNVVLDTGSPNGVAAAANASSGADLAVVVVGDTAGSCGESDDRMELDLLGNQLDLLEAVLATGTPTLTVLIHGRPGECRHTHADHRDLPPQRRPYRSVLDPSQWTRPIRALHCAVLHRAVLSANIDLPSRVPLCVWACGLCQCVRVCGCGCPQRLLVAARMQSGVAAPTAY